MVEQLSVGALTERICEAQDGRGAVLSKKLARLCPKMEELCHYAEKTDKLKPEPKLVAQLDQFSLLAARACAIRTRISGLPPGRLWRFDVGLATAAAIAIALLLAFSPGPSLPTLTVALAGPIQPQKRQPIKASTPAPVAEKHEPSFMGVILPLIDAREGFRVRMEPLETGKELPRR